MVVMNVSAHNAKICIVTPEFPPVQWGGLARTVARTASIVAGMGYDTHVAWFDMVDDPVVLLDENRVTSRRGSATLHQLKIGREHLPEGARDLWDCHHNLTLQMMYQSLELLHQEERFDLFHSFFLFPVGYVTGLIARRMKRPHIASIVGNDVKKYFFSPEKTAMCRSGLENADIVAGLSRELVEVADSLTPVLDKARVIFNSVEIPHRPDTPDGRHGDPFRIGCAAIFKFAKGLPYLLKAVAAVREEDTTRYARAGVELELAGTLRREERPILEAGLNRWGLASIVKIRGPVQYELMPEWFATLDCFVLPSISEGCPNVLMEAMAMGLPCVAAEVGAVPDLMEHGVSGFVVPRGNAAAIADALRLLMGDPERAKSLGACAREHIRLFSEERERIAWAGVYGDLIGR
jgi:L-malate glycosyltransferase